MKTIALAMAFGFAGGAALSYSYTANKYEQRHAEYIKSVEQAEKVRADKSKEITDELYEKWRNAISVPVPDPVIRRVYVRANCPVQTDTGRGVDDGTNAVRVELAERTVQRVERVAIKHAKQYVKCAAQLAGTQAKLSAQ